MLEHLVRSWRGKTARKEMMHPLLIIIDEAVNAAPMPALRRHVSEGRGGVNLIEAVAPWVADNLGTAKIDEALASTIN
ncbi:hypothetical protein [uncultured Mycobacterium sp.]|uniref:hypothetical protein n=1 Tax=uncultured Mycobacterium sp. TaxID=171292 RepID=UPI0035CBB70D